MKLYFNLLFVLCLCSVFVGCTKENEQTARSGFVISLGDAAVDVTSSRATPKELGTPLDANFHIKVVNTATSSTVYDAAFAQFIPVNAGTYELTASYGDNPELEFDAPYYIGTATAEHQKNVDTPVTIPCKVGNALLSVVFENADIFGQQYTKYGLRVDVGSSSKTIDSGETAKSLYFKAGSDVKIYFEATTKNNAPYTVDFTGQLASVLPFAAADHAIVRLSASAFGLKLEKVSVEKVTVNETIPVEWLPKPKVSGFSEITYVETDDAPQNAEIDYTASLPIQDMELTLNMQDEQYSAYNKTYTLSTLSDADRTDLGKLGIELPEVGEVKTGAINLQNLIGTMQTNAGTTVDNTFRLRVKANNRWSDETTVAETYTVKVVKPEFTVSVYPGNIWTKEFTVNSLTESEVTKGNFEKINSSLEYQYSADNTNWETINNSDLQQKGLTPGKQYYVRAYYRKAVSSAVKSIVTGDEIAMPYGDMESWTSETKKLIPGANIFKHVNITGYNPDNNIWACVNQKTFGGSPNVSSTYNLNPSTYRETGRGGNGYAAALRTVGWDNGSGNTTSIIYHISAGKLFIGSYSFTHKSGPENYNYGMEYNSRPTALKAYFKYAPYSGDSFKAWIVLENREKADEVKRIGYGEVIKGDAVSSFSELNIPITYDEKYQEYDITHMYVVFSSSAACSENESDETDNLKGKVSGGDYHNGSVLTIDDISLVYDK